MLLYSTKVRVHFYHSSDACFLFIVGYHTQHLILDFAKTPVEQFYQTLLVQFTSS